MGSTKKEKNTGKKHIFHTGRNSGRVTLSPLENISLTPLLNDLFDPPDSVLHDVFV